MGDSSNDSKGASAREPSASERDEPIKVLIVEDESVFAMDIMARLKQLGYEPCGHALSLAGGLELARQQSPDLILMDINLGDGGDGVEAAKVFSDEMGVPVIFLTAYSDRATVQRASTIHPFGFLLKPVGDCQLDIAIQFAMERFRMEELLKASERRLRVTLQSIGDAVISTDAQGRVTFVNPSAEILCGMVGMEVRGQHFDRVVHLAGEHEGLPFLSQVHSLLEAGAPFSMGQALSFLVRSDGSKIPVNEMAFPIIGSHQRIEGVVVVLRDISKEQAQRGNAEKAARLRSLGSLSAGIAHDFNNITTSILGNLELALVAACSVPGDLVEHLDRACKACLRAKGVTQQLLTFAAGGEPVCVAADLKTILRNTAEYVVGDAPVKLVFEIADDLSPVMADTGQISQVIHNISMNALQALSGRGTLRVSAQNLAQDAGSESQVRARDLVVLQIEDDGPGISEDLLPHIFDPFFSTKELGRGLGLASAFSIVQRHGGEIRVESSAGKGTSVKIILPALGGRQGMGKKAADPGVKKALPAAVPVLNRRVLVVDDEEGVCFVTSSMLKAHACEVDTVLNGEDALDRVLDAQATGKPYAVAVLDLTFPGGLGGHEILLELRKVQPGLLAIVCSGYSDDPVFSKPEAYGFNGGLRKPFTRTELFAVIDRVLGSGGANA